MHKRGATMMTSKQANTHALRAANRAGAQRRVPGGELCSADVALALARHSGGNAASDAKAVRLLAGLLSKRKVK